MSVVQFFARGQEGRRDGPKLVATCGRLYSYNRKQSKRRSVLLDISLKRTAE
jgi:hypothetical protein